MPSSAEIPAALTIAGSDCSAGAGAQADLKTFSALGVYGLTALTCVVAEIAGKVARIDPLPVESVRAQLEILAGAYPVRAAKTGMLHSVEIVREVARWWRESGWQIPLVVDPVMLATSGDRLLQESAVRVYEEELFPRAALLTPNLDEASILLDAKISSAAELASAGRALGEKYGVPVLMKGGHLEGANAVDLLVSDGEVRAYSRPFVRGAALHGTGCTYSAAITAHLAHGVPLADAIERAKDFITRALTHSLRWAQPDGGVTQALHLFS